MSARDATQRTVAVAQQTHHARSVDTRRDLVARIAQALCGDARRARFLHRKLGMGVNIGVELFQTRQQRVKAGKRRLVRENRVRRRCRHDDPSIS